MADSADDLPARARDAAVHCRFYIRTDVGGGQFRYEPAGAPEGIGYLRPPAAGDLISLYDYVKKAGGQYRVIHRPQLNIIVVPDTGGAV